MCIPHLIYAGERRLRFTIITGIPKHLLPEKVFGVFRHQPLDLYHPLLRGFSDVFYVPHSRHTENRKEDIIRVKDLQILSYSEEAGVHLVSDIGVSAIFTVRVIANMIAHLGSRVLPRFKKGS